VQCGVCAACVVCVLWKAWCLLCAVARGGAEARRVAEVIVCGVVCVLVWWCSVVVAAVV